MSQMPTCEGAPLVAWQKLNQVCHACGHDHAEIEYTFMNKRGTIKRAWHTACLPADLAEWQRMEEQSWLETLQTPLGA